MNKHAIDQSSHQFNVFLMQVLNIISAKTVSEKNKELPPLYKKFVILALCYKDMLPRARATRLSEELNVEEA